MPGEGKADKNSAIKFCQIFIPFFDIEIDIRQ